MNNSVGVYQIINLRNGKCYIGSSKNIVSRFKQHRYYLRKNCHPNKHLQSSWNKYGSNTFEFRKVINCRSEDLIQIEKYWITYFQAEYNLAIPVDIRRWTLSDETKRKIGLKSIGRFHSQESRDRRRQAMLGHIKSELTRQRLSDSHKGKPSPRKGKQLTEEHRQNISKANKGKPSPNKGKTMTQEQKDKIAASNQGQSRSEEVKVNISKAKLGKKRGPMSEEQKKKISESEKRTKQKISNTCQ